jgi:hypothetical protein
MRLYYLDRNLGNDEVTFVVGVLRLSEPIEQIRIPHVLPVPDLNGEYSKRPIIDTKLIETHLLNAGIFLDRGKKVYLVAPRDRHWRASLISAIFKCTGRYPCLIEAEDRRDYLGNPVGIRVVDMDELIGRHNTEI